MFLNTRRGLPEIEPSASDLAAITDLPWHEAQTHLETRLIEAAAAGTATVHRLPTTIDRRRGECRRMSWEWMRHAACRHEGDPEIFFPLGNRDECTNLALSICQGCPVIRECYEIALAHGFTGIWGGTTEDERDGVRREGVWAA